MIWKALLSKKAMIAIVIMAVLMSSASVFLVLAYSDNGQATGKMERDKIRETALSKVKEFSPETIVLENLKEYSTDYEASYFLKTAKGKISA